MPWMMAAYVAFAVSISVRVYYAAGIGAATCALIASCLAVVAGGGLKFGLFWAAGAQRLVISFVAVVLLVVMYGVSRGFSLPLFGYSLRGELWAALGVIVGFIAVDQRAAADLKRD